ncbi:hypothetical protein [Pseudomonas canadensis]|uniref:hypothetical protein n=1 Tax=Pseudomonas canadensis TaxID=915099 RepID=UPI0030D981C0
MLEHRFHAPETAAREHGGLPTGGGDIGLGDGQRHGALGLRGTAEREQRDTGKTCGEEKGL